MTLRLLKKNTNHGLTSIADEYSGTHEMIRGREERLESYNTCYQDMQEMQEIYPVQGALKEKIERLMNNLNELILYETSQMEKDTQKRESLMQQYKKLQVQK